MAHLFNNAKIFIAGYDFSGDFNQVALDYSAESLDATVFGNASRVKQGGLKDASVAGRGFWQAAVGKSDPVMFDNVGVADAVVMLYPDTITEGATSTGSGYMFKAVEVSTRHGGAVGDLNPFEFSAHGRGVSA